MNDVNVDDNLHDFASDAVYNRQEIKTSRIIVNIIDAMC